MDTNVLQGYSSTKDGRIKDIATRNAGEIQELPLLAAGLKNTVEEWYFWKWLMCNGCRSLELLPALAQEGVICSQPLRYVQFLEDGRAAPPC